jgi:putative transposase
MARKVSRTREQARSDVFDCCMERFYNPTRRHSTLGYVSPIEVKEAHEAYVGVHCPAAAQSALLMIGS